MSTVPYTLRKRKRSLSDDPNPSAAETDAGPGLTRSAELYFDDGNIVLIAENVAFRVYKGQLARHSAVFRDMFSLVNQPANGETFDRCPTVRLSDTSRDITMLLSALNDITQFTCDTARDIRVLTGVLRMATKYLMDPLRNSCIRALRGPYPDTLAKWDRHNGIRFNPNVILQLIDADILLPSAYYALCSMSLKELSVVKYKLPSHVLEAYCKGKEEIAKCFASFLEKYISVDAISARTGMPCEIPRPKDCKSAWESLRTIAMSKVGDPDQIIRPAPLRILQDLQKDLRSKGMCNNCCSHLRMSIDDTRLGIWESLPEAFGLGTWKELREKYADSPTSQP